MGYLTAMWLTVRGLGAGKARGVPVDAAALQAWAQSAQESRSVVSPAVFAVNHTGSSAFEVRLQHFVFAKLRASLRPTRRLGHMRGERREEKRREESCWFTSFDIDELTLHSRTSPSSDSMPLHSPVQTGL
eukprot:761684-Hanusia_phi.AAC.5